MERIRVLHSRDHTTIYPKLGVFLAGPTPPTGEMENGWRNKIIEELKKDKRLNPSMTVVAPEPESGNWEDIEEDTSTELGKVLNKQLPWEWQYLSLCDITAFWLPTYWGKEKAGVFPNNIGPTTRWEFGYYFQEYLKDRDRRNFIIGGPEDAEGVKWAKRIADIHGIKWHFLAESNKDKLVADSFIEEIATRLIEGKWDY